MKKIIALLPIIIILFVSAACQSPLWINQPDETQTAAEKYATQTALVPTIPPAPAQTSTHTPLPTATPPPTATPSPTPSLAEQLIGRQCITRYYDSEIHDDETLINQSYRLETILSAIDDNNILVEVSYRNSDYEESNPPPWQYSRNLITGASSVISENGSKQLDKEVLDSSSDTELQYSLAYTYIENDWRHEVSGTAIREPGSFLTRSRYTTEEIYDIEGNYWGTYQDEMYLVSCSSQPAVDVNLDGSGDYASLKEAIAAVPAGTTIWLSPGTFTLSESLLIDKSIRIFGSGQSLTSITSQNIENSLMSFEGPGSFMLRDIALEYNDSTAGHVLVIRNGIDIDIQNSRFSGGVRDEEKKSGGLGIFLDGSTNGILKGNQVFDNSFHGIMVKGDSEVNIDLNYIHHNGLTGITFFDDSRGTVSRNTIENNGQHGLSVNESAHADITDNYNHLNNLIGIHISGVATAVIENNECQANGQHGIAISGGGYAEIYDNTLLESTRTGLIFLEKAGGIVQDNTIAYNNINGIHLKGQSEARIENNIIYDNKEAGLIFVDSSAGVVIANEIYGNKWGLYIEAGTSPETANNVIHDNSIENIHDER